MSFPNRETVERITAAWEWYTALMNAAPLRTEPLCSMRTYTQNKVCIIVY